MLFEEKEYELKQTMDHIKRSILKKMNDLDAKSKVVSEKPHEPLIIDYQGKIYKVYFEYAADGFFIKTFTDDRSSILLDQIMSSRNLRTGKDELMVFISRTFVPVDALGGDSPTSYNYYIESYILDFATRLHKKNIFYDQDLYS